MLRLRLLLLLLLWPTVIELPVCSAAPPIGCATGRPPTIECSAKCWLLPKPQRCGAALLASWLLLLLFGFAGVHCDAAADRFMLLLLPYPSVVLHHHCCTGSFAVVAAGLVAKLTKSCTLWRLAGTRWVHMLLQLHSCCAVAVRGNAAAIVANGLIAKLARSCML
jgi:hypothetical protein